MQFDQPNLPAPIEPVRNVPIQPGWDLDLEESTTPLSHYLWTLRRQRWKRA